MLSNLGNSILFLGVLSSLIIISKSYQSLRDNSLDISKKIYNLCLIQSTLIFSSFLILVAAFIVSDFSLISVYQNSHTLKPLLYKISEPGEIMRKLVTMANNFNFFFFFVSHLK